MHYIKSHAQAAFMTALSFAIVLSVVYVYAQDSVESQTRYEQPDPKPDLPNITIIATGGTIAGVGESNTSATYQPGQLGIVTLIEAVPQIKNVANISGIQFSQISSQNMTDDYLIKLTHQVNELLSHSDIDGVVITHGTDTLEETAYFLNLAVDSDKPIIVVGSMRPATSLSADGPLNLYNAVALAANPQAKGKGVLVAMDDLVIAARDVTKRNVHQTDTFQSANDNYLGEINYGDFRELRIISKKHTVNSGFTLSKDTNSLPRVAIIYANQNMSGDIIRSAADLGYDGLVIAGVGDGNMSESALDAVKDVIQEGVPVVRASRIPSGFIKRNNEINDDEIGTVTADDLLPQKARILLKFAITKTKNPKQLQEYFYNY
ncbi:putative L-asparaginase periplasmic precursor [Poriferisphaera corsica]|uniref:Putative L-asparaginase periplasmic n=1 Tax=Poriferisphaera corsica TaxID=2528020 RepID=A0A517YU38_9BACT|nr:type II asparaginase [Poriferisphaera corsica]QDU33741.1 putative L-asparaginase periplasmic precursor [Poriferisphaera corsica]